jgi:hypothetical protein
MYIRQDISCCWVADIVGFFTARSLAVDAFSLSYVLFPAISTHFTVFQIQIWQPLHRSSMTLSYSYLYVWPPAFPFPPRHCDYNMTIRTEHFHCFWLLSLKFPSCNIHGGRVSQEQTFLRFPWTFPQPVFIPPLHLIAIWWQNLTPSLWPESILSCFSTLTLSLPN